MRVKKVNAFTESIDGGNPAGVVTNPSQLTEEQMKYISKKLAVSETAFVFPSNKADFKVRFFSPKIEVDLCGHATIATFFTMAEEGVFPQKKERISITQETKAGILPVNVYFKNSTCEKVMMTQVRSSFKEIKLNIEEIANALNIKRNEIDESLPNQIVSTGLFTLPVCVKSFTTLQKMKPNFNQIKKICMDRGFGSFHVFTFETLEKTSTYHARNFAPCYGIDEDPVTGTANGAVTSYLVKNGIIKEKQLICEQGDIIGRPGRVFVDIEGDVVRVGGKAKLVEETEIEV
ncbi:MAG: PhzF family phenazine biosynthesis protein [Thermoplasmatales archaeon]|nr:MAG: PhzF family phenazine biosynthesis protein [Thermoplasmatales archaeon]